MGREKDMEEAKLAPKNFIEEFIQQDIQEKGLSHIQTRFPPVPNGYLHIGHVKALYIDFSMAERFGGKCNLAQALSAFQAFNTAKEDSVKEIRAIGDKYNANRAQRRAQQQSKNRQPIPYAGNGKKRHH